MPDVSKVKILICPLDWGWGHVTRMIPVIRILEEMDVVVVLGVSGSSGELLKEEFPGVKTIKLPSYGIRYNKRKSLVLTILFQLPKLVSTIIKEKRLLKKLLSTEKFHLVISDNRFGLRSQSVKSIFITHQLNVKFPPKLKLAEKIFNYFQHLIIKKYDECWVPDDKERLDLTGELSEVPKVLSDIQYIGILSRFETLNNYSSKVEYDLFILLSGPEPQRTILEEIIRRQIRYSKLKILFVRGTREKDLPFNTGNILYHNYLTSSQIQEAMKKSGMVVARAGYSTIMDLVKLEKIALLIPTPGQPEQEYLADFLKRKGFFYSVCQEKLNLLEDIEEARKFAPPFYEDRGLLKKKIQEKIACLACDNNAG